MSTVLYHGNCYDGFGAAWAAKEFLGTEGVVYRPVNYGEPVPDIEKTASLFIIDFSYPRDVLLNEVAALADKVVVLDHHKTAEEELKGLPSIEDGGALQVHFDMKKSGAVLAWEYFHPGLPCPRLLLHIQDRDLWEFKMAGSKEAHAFLRSHPFLFDLWDEFVDSFDMAGGSRIFDEGKGILRSSDQTVAMMCEKARVKLIDGHHVALVNATCHWSEVGHYLTNKFPNADYGASFCELKNGDIMWSLRSVGDFDVSAVAKAKGGGGHKNAAGYIEKFTPTEVS